MSGARRFGAAALLTAFTLLASSAHAKPWAEWAPAPLASDSAYAVLAALPHDSLDAGQLAWLALQRDWRAQRTAEEADPPGSIARAGRSHAPRPEDARFAALASCPYGALSANELAWLVAESRAQAKLSAPETVPSMSPAAALGTAAGFFAVIFWLALGDLSRHRPS